MDEFDEVAEVLKRRFDTGWITPGEAIGKYTEHSGHTSTIPDLSKLQPFRGEAREQLKIIKEMGFDASDAMAVIALEVASSDDPFRASGEWITKVTNAVTEAAREAEAERDAERAGDTGDDADAES